MKKRDEKLPGETNPEEEKKKKEKRKKRRRYIWWTVGAFVAFIIWFGFQPLQGTMAVGVCRTYAQLTLEYPETMKTIGVENFDQATRIYYTFTDAFGGHRSNRIECEFGADPATGATIATSIVINSTEEDKSKVDAFNKTISAIVSSNPDLRVPFPPSDDLMSLKED